MATLSRRALLRRCGLGFGYVALADLLDDRMATGSERSPRTHFQPRANRVIFLFMKGGPSHVDTFDYKPRLQADDGKPVPFAKPRVQFAPTGNLLGSPWKFLPRGQSGIEVSEL